MQQVASAAERKQKMAQQRQLALGRQRNAVLTGLGVVANRDVPAGPNHTTLQQQKQALSRLLAPAYDTHAQVGATQVPKSPCTAPADSRSLSASPPLGTSHKRPDTGLSSALDAGVEVFRLSTPLKRPEGVEAPDKPLVDDKGLWNLQCDALQASPLPQPVGESGKRSSLSSWRASKSPSKAQAGVGGGGDADGILAFDADEVRDKAWDNGHASPRGQNAGYTAVEKSEPTAPRAAVSAVGPQETCAVETMQCRPETPTDTSKFCRPSKVAAPPFGATDPFDELQELLMAN